MCGHECDILPVTSNTDGLACLLPFACMTLKMCAEADCPGMKQIIYGVFPVWVGCIV